MSKQLAKISSAKLNIRERGILTFWIHVDYENGGSQGIGGFSLDDYCKEKNDRIGTAYGCEMIRCLLLELCVNDFSEMVGKHIWVIGHGEGFAFKPTGIQALRVDNRRSKPVIFQDVVKQFVEHF